MPIVRGRNKDSPKVRFSGQESSESINAASFVFVCVLKSTLTHNVTQRHHRQRFSISEMSKTRDRWVFIFPKVGTMKLFLLVASFVGLVGAQVVPDVTPMDYEHQGDALQGFLAMPESPGDMTPAVIIIP
jgi:hypothetical protein